MVHKWVICVIGVAYNYIKYINSGNTIFYQYFIIKSPQNNRKTNNFIEILTIKL